MITEMQALFSGVEALYNAIQERELVSPYYKGKQAGLMEVMRLMSSIGGWSNPPRQNEEDGEADA